MGERIQTPETKGAVIHWAGRYDLLVKLLTLGREGVFRDRVLHLARIAPGESVLDVGCGTGTLAIAAKKKVGREGTVEGIDPSPEMIARACRKAARAGVDVQFTTAVAEALPCPDAQFDVVLASMMIHHLPRDVRLQGFREMRRVLTPGGRLLAVDFGGPERKRRGLIAHFHRHVQFDLHDVVPLLNEAGLDRLESGALGFGSLQFVLAAASGAA